MWILCTRPSAPDGGITSLAYDAAGNVTARTDPNLHTTSYAYDDAGRRTSKTDPLSRVFSTAYDAAGSVNSETNGRGTVTYSYDAANRLTSIRSVKGASTIAAPGYTLDPVGNPTQITRDGETEHYSYDASDRITAACYGAPVPSCPSGSLITYSYDYVGNRQSQSRFGVPTSYSYDTANQLTQTVSGGTTLTYGYDAAGNETIAGSRTITYDLATRVTQITDGSTTLAAFTYDGDGDRLTKTAAAVTTSYRWDTNADLSQVALEQQGGSTVRSYQYGLELLSMTTSGSRFYYHHDNLGTTAAITNTTGALQWSYRYDPYSNERGHTKNDPTAPDNVQQYTGQLLDPETGLYDLHARLYDPTTGRFGSTDPLQSDLNESAISAYAYASDRPVVLVDPSGARPIVLADPKRGAVDFVYWKLDPTSDIGIVTFAGEGGLSTTNRRVTSGADDLVSAAGEISDGSKNDPSVTIAQLGITVVSDTINAYGVDDGLVSTRTREMLEGGLRGLSDEMRCSPQQRRELHSAAQSYFCRRLATALDELRPNQPGPITKLVVRVVNGVTSAVGMV